MREAEEAAALEEKKVEQRRRELQEEREMEALRRLQGKSTSTRETYVSAHILALFMYKNLTFA